MAKDEDGTIFNTANARLGLDGPGVGFRGLSDSRVAPWIHLFDVQSILRRPSRGPWLEGRRSASLHRYAVVGVGPGTLDHGPRPDMSGLEGGTRARS